MSLIAWQPSVDILYSGAQWYVKLDLAGIYEHEIEISTDQNRLIIKGVRRDTLVNKHFVYHSLEIRYSKFERVIELPFEIDSSKIHSNYQDGILFIQLHDSRHN
tara:strand:+ start:818 stop:1129 length:312 start_codon:yes stop_codon:yes gene_type:complete